MLALVKFSSKSKVNTLCVIAVSSFLSLAFDLIAIFCAALITFIALTQGRKESVQVFAVALIVLLGSSLLIYEALWPSLQGLVYIFPCLILGIFFTVKKNLSQTIILSGVICIVSFLIFMLLVGNLEQWWLERVEASGFSEVLQELDVNTELFTPVKIASLLTVITPAIYLSCWLISFVWALWWNYKLYQSFDFRREFVHLNLGKWSSIFVLGLFAYVNLLNDGLVGITGILLVICLTLFLLQGIATVHCFAKHFKLAKGWLIAMYVMLIVFPQTLVIISLCGLAEAVMQWRNRFIPDYS